MSCKLLVDTRAKVHSGRAALASIRPFWSRVATFTDGYTAASEAVSTAIASVTQEDSDPASIPTTHIGRERYRTRASE